MGALVLLFLLLFSYNRELYRINKSLSTLAILDPLTKAYNKLMVQEFSANQFEKSRSAGTPLSFIFIDIDDFKNINDNYGHVSGDQVLKAVSNYIFSNISKDDILGRTGGDEFVIILPNTSSTMAMHAAERIRMGVQALRIPDDEGKFISATISLGVSSYRDGIKTVDQLIKEADQALYASKGKTKNQSILFE